MLFKNAGRKRNVLESLTPAPCLGFAVLGSVPWTFAWELRSFSACLAMSRGFWPLYSADMIDVVVVMTWEEMEVF